MIELVCPKCKEVFERRGKKRGGKPFCLKCEAKK